MTISAAGLAPTLTTSNFAFAVSTAFFALSAVAVASSNLLSSISSGVPPALPTSATGAFVTLSVSFSITLSRFNFRLDSASVPLWKFSSLRILPSLANSFSELYSVLFSAFCSSLPSSVNSFWIASRSAAELVSFAAWVASFFMAFRVLTDSAKPPSAICSIAMDS
ncbi:Uncharacterised protein [Yersinia pseudotuberculosis]|nr:Uncharacterised protein [Yersinia pseudotuberculosis]